MHIKKGVIGGISDHCLIRADIKVMENTIFQRGLVVSERIKGCFERKLILSTQRKNKILEINVKDKK